MEQEKGKWFVKIPSFIMTDDRLNGREKLFFGSVLGFNLQALTSNKSVSTPTYEVFGTIFNVSYMTISNWVEHLVDCGYLQKSTTVISGYTRFSPKRIRVTLLVTDYYFSKLQEVFEHSNDDEVKWFTFLPGDIVTDFNMCATSKCLLSDIAGLCYEANNGKYSSNATTCLTNEQISTIYNVSEQTASNCISELEKFGYIQRILRPTAEGTERTIILTEKCCKMFNEVNCPFPYTHVPLSQYTELKNNDEPTEESVKKKPKPKRTTSYDKYKEDIEEVIGYLNEKTGKKFRPTSNCNYTDLVRVFKQEYTVADCKKVIDNKFREWKGTDFEQYLRPKTLFGNKFDTYLNAEYRMSEQTRQHNLGTYMTEDGTPIHVATGQVKVEDI